MKLELINVSKISNRKRREYSLQDVNLSLIDHKNTVILSAHEHSSNALLNLIAGVEKATRGKIIRDGIFTGPTGDPAYFHRELSGEENVRFICKLYGQNSNIVLREIREHTKLAKELKQKTKNYTPLIRRKIAISTSLLMESDIYQLKGKLVHPDTDFNSWIQNRILKLSRNSMLLSTNDPDFIQDHAQQALTINPQGYLQSFSNVQSGIDTYNSFC